MQVFNQGGMKIDSIQELVDQGILFTTTLKYGITGYALWAATVKECAQLLKQEVALFTQRTGFHADGRCGH